MGRITRVVGKTAAITSTVTSPVTTKVTTKVREKASQTRSDYLDARADLLENRQVKSLERRNKRNMKRAKAAKALLDRKMAEAKDRVREGEPLDARSAALAEQMRNLFGGQDPADVEADMLAFIEENFPTEKVS